MLERFSKGSTSNNIAIEAFVSFFVEGSGPRPSPAKDGWGPLPGSGAGAIYELGSDKIFWPSKKAAAKDAAVFKGHMHKAQKMLSDAVAKGDSAGARSAIALENYSYSCGVKAFSFAGDEYFVLPEREAQMVEGARTATFGGAK